MHPISFVIVGIICAMVAALVIGPPAPVPDESVDYTINPVILEEDITGYRSLKDTFGSTGEIGYPMLGVDALDDYRYIRLDVQGRVLCAPGPARVRPKFESNFP